MKNNKYHAKKWQGYDSKHEAERARVLRLMAEAGEITDLREQVPYELVPAQWEVVPRYGKNGQALKPQRRCVERAIIYIADFVYTDANGKEIVEDAKGYKGGEAYKLFVLKRKLMLLVHHIKVREV